MLEIGLRMNDHNRKLALAMDAGAAPEAAAGLEAVIADLDRAAPEGGLDTYIDLACRILDRCMLNATAREVIANGIQNIDVYFRGGFLSDALSELAEDATEFWGGQEENPKRKGSSRDRRSSRDEILFLTEVRTRLLDMLAQMPESEFKRRSLANADVIADVFGLRDYEARMLYILHAATEMSPIAKVVNNLTSDVSIREAALCAFIDADRSSVKELLNGRSLSVRRGVLILDPDYSGFTDQFELRPPIRIHMGSEDLEPEELRAGLLPKAQAASISLSNAPHLQADADLCIRALKGAKAAGTRNVSILLYGPPGTGKTELSRIILAEAGYQAFAVAEEEDGADLDREARIGDLLMAHALLENDPDAACVFDEMEDLTVRRTGEGSKIVLNRFLDDAKVPTVFVANDLDMIPDYLLRRMMLVLEVPVPPVQIQRSILKSLACEAAIEVEDGDIARMQGVADVVPAVARSAVKAASLAGGGARDLERAYLNLNSALTGRRLKSPRRAAQDIYRPEFSETDIPLAGFVEKLRGRGAIRASFLFFGAAGTGKSAGARHIADAMGVKVIEKRGSDLLGAYVGESEKLIRSAFEEARDERAALVFDEIDSLLSDRSDHGRSWETSQVNEFLKALEDHDAPVFGCTNLRDRMDKAAMRRFLFHVEFKTLPGEKAAACFTHYLGLPAPDAIASLSGLTPAHFGLVKARCEMMGIESPAEMVRMLEKEAVDFGGGRKIGFQAA